MNSIGRNTSLNFVPFVANILSDKRFYKDIDEIYKNNEIKFNIESKKSKFYNCFSNGSALKQLYYHRALGIIESKELALKDTCDILGKYYRYEFTYSYNLKIFRMSEYIQRINKKFNKEISTNEFNNRLVVMILICMEKGIKIDTEDALFKIFIETMKKMLMFEKNIEIRINYTKATQEDKNTIYKQFKRIQKENPYLLKEGAEPSDKLTENKSATEFIFDIFNLSLGSLEEDVELTDNEVLSILYCYLVAHQGVIEDNKDLDNWLSYAIKLAYILKAYNESKEYLLNNNNEELLLKIQELNEENKKLNNNLDISINKINLLEKENVAILNENNKLKLEIEKLSKDKKEINSLREYVFNNSNLDEEFANVTFNTNEVINKLNQLDVIIIGGKSGWINKIKEILSSWSYIPTDSINFDVRLLNNKYVLFNTDYVSHSMYYKVIENISKAKQLNFFSGSTNINLSLKKIYEIYYK